MKFTYDQKRHRVVDSKSGAVVYQSSKLLDAGALCLFIYEREGLVVEFEAVPVSESWSHRWKGQERVGQFDTSLYIIEPKLRGNFIQASKSRSGITPDDKSYKNFLDVVVEGMTVLLRSAASQMSQDPNFEIKKLPDVEVRFVQRYVELPDHIR
jgi:hypothetical protein